MVTSTIWVKDAQNSTSWTLTTISKLFAEIFIELNIQYHLYQVDVVYAQEVQAVLDRLQYVILGEVKHVFFFEGIAPNLTQMTYSCGSVPVLETTSSM